MWHTFFTELNLDVVPSGQTNKNILDKGVKEALADACVPVKLFFGHALTLRDKADYLFIPRVVCLNKKTIYCPKFLGLPDMIRYGLNGKGMPPLIDIQFDAREGRQALLSAYSRIGSMFGAGPLQIARAYIKARYCAARYNTLLKQGWHPPEAIKAVLQRNSERNNTPDKSGSLNFAVLGYPYIVHDDYISVGLIGKLKKLGVNSITLENLPTAALARQSCDLDKVMFWTYSDLVLRAIHYLFKNGRADGIIHLTAFGCGPDSMVDKLMEMTARKYGNIPFMSLTIDEHSGDAGVSTRLEAFTDMVKRKKRGF
jgi:predicted nucleotide-binding protein (sugar kinase/HSP70/actin superfamily)